MLYWLMRKDDVLLPMEISDSGALIRVGTETKHPELLPAAYRKDRAGGIRQWWSERSIPLSQGRVKAMLEEKGIPEPGEYLFRNLGLSLTDYYWIRPINSSLRWADVNLYDNDFKENLMVRIEDSSPVSYTPNSSLQGELEKSWQIREGKRILIKGNSDILSCESLNEVFACELHRRQNSSEYTQYHLIKIKDRPYAFGCWSELFTSQSVELVPAWALVNSEKRPSNRSVYEHLVLLCVQGGLNEDYVRGFLEYQIITDYILSNRDRHLNNIGILRDADTLKYIGFAPIYDSGKSMFVRSTLPARYADLIDQQTNSFANTEQKLLALVHSRNRVKPELLPRPTELEELYSRDPHLTEERIRQVSRAYEMKLSAFIDWQK